MADSNDGPNYRRQGNIGAKPKPHTALPDKVRVKKKPDSIESDDSESSSDSSSSESEDSSSDEYEEDESETAREAADAEALGVDLTKYMKKEAFEFYKDKIEDRIQDLVESIDILDGKLQHEIKEKASEYAKGVEIIEARLEEHMVPVRADVEILLKTR